MTLDEVRLFVRNYPNYQKIFGDAIIEKAAKYIPCNKFATIEYIPYEWNSTYHRYKEKYPVVGEDVTHTFTEERPDGWHRHVEKKCCAFRVPDQYQLGETGKDGLLYKCILEVFPEAANHELAAYHLDKPDSQVFFYKYIYAPVDALVNFDWETIKRGSIDYFKNFWRSENQQKYLQEALETIETKGELLRKDMERRRNQ